MNTVNESNFNETMKGYIIRACKIKKLTQTEVDELFGVLSWSIDEMTMNDARMEYKKYIDGKIKFKINDY